MVMTTVITPNSGLETATWQSIQATAQALDGFTVREDFMDEIVEYLRKETILWPMLRKRAAEADMVKEAREGLFPSSGFVSKGSLNPPENASSFPAHDLSDPGQEVKAMSGVIEFGHYAKSLYAQQGRKFGDIIADKTEKLIVSIARQLEQALFVGNAASNPLQFNGLSLQMQANHTFVCDTTAEMPDSIVKKLRSIVRLASSDILIKRKITHIFCSGLGLEKVEEEVGTALTYQNLVEITPGLQVPAIITQLGRIPVIPTPYITDVPGATATDPDVLDFYLVDMDLLEWRGVVPDAGNQTWEPQIFDVSPFTTNATPYLVEKRMGLIYGTLYAHNRGEGIYKLRVRVNPNSIGTV